MNDWTLKSISGYFWIRSPYLTWLNAPPVVHFWNSENPQTISFSNKTCGNNVHRASLCCETSWESVVTGCSCLHVELICLMSLFEKEYIANKRNKMNRDKQYLIWNKPTRVFYQQIHQNCTITVQHLRRGTYCIIMYLVERSKIEQSGKAKIRRRVNDDKTIYRKLYPFVLNTF